MKKSVEESLTWRVMVQFSTRSSWNGRPWRETTCVWLGVEMRSLTETKQSPKNRCPTAPGDTLSQIRSGGLSSVAVADSHNSTRSSNDFCRDMWLEREIRSIEFETPEELELWRQCLERKQAKKDSSTYCFLARQKMKTWTNVIKITTRRSTSN